MRVFPLVLFLACSSPVAVSEQFFETPQGTFLVAGELTEEARSEIIRRSGEIWRDLERDAPGDLYLRFRPEDVELELTYSLHQYVSYRLGRHWVRVGPEAQSMNHEVGDHAACYHARDVLNLISPEYDCSSIGHSWEWGDD